MEPVPTRIIPKTSLPDAEGDAKALFSIGMEDDLPPDDDSTMIIAPPRAAKEQHLMEQPGDYIGRYCLEEPLGEGGFGTVWLAEQHEPIRRKVALKVIKAGMDSREIIARFDAERQALALMDHPNIASVLDAGATATGRPFFVMELVKGPPITKYCDVKRLTVRQRLELFIPVCQAVQHAHQKAILHRDLKPSNILVSEVDGKPVPMVIDFGIAKALGTHGDAAFASDLIQTMQGVIIGTPQYMSPEQAGLEGLDVDTRSDIYSLGVILFELLTGDTPLPSEVLRKSPIDEVLRHIREEDAKRPSSRLIHMTEKVRTTAQQRHTLAPRLTQVLKRDLDWIVLRALEKDRRRRYDTATSLALDIMRYLNDEPVSATPPSMGYRFMKMVRRHRKSMAAAAAVVLSLVVGLAATTYALDRERAALTREAAERVVAEQAREQAEIARGQAEQRRKEAEESRQKAEASRLQAEAAEKAERTAKQIAQTAQEKAEGLIEDMLIDLRGKLVPLGRSALLANVAESAEKYFTDLPQETLNDVQWRQRAMLAEFRGMIALSRGDRATAQEKFDAALAMLKQRVASAPQDPARLRDLAVAYQGVGVGNEEVGALPQAREMLIQQVELVERLRALQPSVSLHKRDLAIAHTALARLDAREDKWSDAESHLAVALPLLEQEMVADPTSAMLQRDYASALEQQAAGFTHSKGLDKAQKVLEATVQLRRSIVAAGQGNPSYQRQLGVSLERLADNLMAQGQSATALPMYQERRDIAVSLVQADPLDVGLQTDLMSVREKLAGALEAEKGWKDALILRGEIVRSGEIRVETTPRDAQVQVALAGALHRYARLCLMTGSEPLVKIASTSLDRAQDLLDAVAKKGVLDVAGIQLRTSVETARAALAKALSGS